MDSRRAFVDGRIITVAKEEGQHFAEQNAHIIVALDLGGVLAPHDVQHRLSQLSALEGQEADLGLLAPALASIRGMKLGITLNERRNGALRVDFEQDISAIRPFAKPLVLEVLANHGVAIDEFDEWDVTVTGTRLEMRGRLEQSGMRRILSLLDAPPPLQDAAQQAPSGSDSQRELLSSQWYFNSLVSLLDDLRGRKQRRRTMGEIGVWFRNYARRIDRLPILNVHPDLVDFGAFVAASLREGQIAVQGAAIRSRLRQQQVPEQFDVRTYSVPIGSNWAGTHGWYGWTTAPNRTRTGQLRSQVRTQERLRGSMSASVLMQQLEVATAEMRRHMTQVFNVEF
jgi:hypothetical protein